MGKLSFAIGSNIGLFGLGGDASWMGILGGPIVGIGARPFTVPLLPFSREVEQLRRLKRSLALYQLVFGQPRQEDLLAHLTEQMSDEEADRISAAWTISLMP